MWEIIKDILKKKACFHDWKLVKETEFGLSYNVVKNNPPLVLVELPPKIRLP